MEHNPSTCPICQKLGNFAQCHPDWWEEHQKAGYKLTSKFGYEYNCNSGYEPGPYTYVLENA